MQLITSKDIERVEIALQPAAEQRKKELLEQAEMVQAVTSPASQAFAVDVQRELHGYLKHVELTRKQVKDPFRQLAERVDAIAKDHVATLSAELDRIKTLVSAYQSAEIAKERERLRKLDEERERIRRKAEDEERAARKRIWDAEEARRREMQEAADTARREAQARLDAEEAKCKADIEAAKTRGEAEAALAEAKALADREAAIEREKAEFKRKELEMQAAQEAQRRQEAADLEAKRQAAVQQVMAAIAATPNRPKVAGQIVAKQWVHEVLDPAVVYSVRPELCEVTVRAAAVKEAIRQGMRDCPGLRIFEKVSVGVRV